MLGHLLTTWLGQVAVGVLIAGVTAALTLGGRRLVATVRRNRTIKPGVWRI